MFTYVHIERPPIGGVGALHPIKLNCFFSIFYILTKISKMSFEPNYYDIQIQPVFVKDGVKYPFTGLKANKESTLEYKFIIDTLRSHFGDALDITEGFIKSTFEIAFLSNTHMKQLCDISEDTGAAPIKYGQSHLRFDIGSYLYDKSPSDYMGEML